MPTQSRQSLTNEVASQPGSQTSKSAGTKDHTSTHMSNHVLQRLLKSRAIQAQLTVSQPDDELEREADRAADRIFETGGCCGCKADDLRIESTNVTVQRACTECEEELQRKASPQFAPTIDSALEAQLNSSSGAGQPMAEDTRTFFEQRFNHDFSAVRIHSGPAAAHNARSINALAYTRGTEINFAAGQYAPNTRQGQKLLAHELAHVVQQGGGKASSKSPSQMVQRACGPAIGAPGGCTPDISDPVGDLVLFDVNCDDYASPADESRVNDFADSMAVGDRVRVHGFASTDGNATFNHNLSCARALKAAFDLQRRMIDPGAIDILEHGPTPGPARTRRSVVLEPVPAVSRPVVPQLTATVVTAPTPGDCGTMNYVIQWGLTRNSDAANGGFVIQELTRTFTDDDCTGTPIPRTLPSGLHYYEAWQVNPGSTTFLAADGSTDTFSLTRGGPTCATGTQTFTGIATYHDNVATLPAHMVRFNPATLANALRSSITDPALGGNTSRPVTHTLTFHWDCCPCSSSPTVVDSHNP